MYFSHEPPDQNLAKPIGANPESTQGIFWHWGHQEVVLATRMFNGFCDTLFACCGGSRICCFCCFAAKVGIPFGQPGSGAPEQGALDGWTVVLEKS